MNREILERIGETLLLSGRAREAVPYLDKALSMQSQPLTLAIRGHAYKALGLWKKACEDFEQARALNTNDQLFWHWQWMWGSLKPAEKTIQFKPKTAAERFWIGLWEMKAFMDSGDERKMRRAQNSCLKAHPSRPEAHLLAGYLFMEQGRAREAAEEFQKSLRIAPSARVSAWLAEAEFRRGDTDAAFRLLEDAARQASEREAPQIQMWNGMLHLWAGRYAQALENLSRGLAVLPRNPDAWTWSGACHWLLGNTGRAQQDLGRALELEGGHAEALLWLSEIRAAQGRLKEAVAHARKAGSAEDEPKRDWALIQKIRFEAGPPKPSDIEKLAGKPGFKELFSEIIKAWRLEAQDLKEAETWRLILEAAQAACRGNRAVEPAPFHRTQIPLPPAPLRARLLEKSCEELLQKGRFRKAMDAAQTALRLQPNNANILALRAHAYKALGNWRKAALDFETLRKRLPENEAWELCFSRGGKFPSDRSFWSLLWNAHERLRSDETHDVEEALRSARRAAQLRPDHPWAWLMLAQAEWSWGVYDLAYKRLRRYERLASRPPAHFYAWRGECRFFMGDTDGAARDFDSSVKASPQKQKFMFLAWRGTFHLWMGRYSDALKDCDRSLKLEPSYAPALCWKGAALCKMGKVRQAVDFLRRSRELDPRNNEALAWHGEALYECGRLKEALIVLSGNRCECDPKFWAWMLRLRIHAERGEKDAIPPLLKSLGDYPLMLSFLDQIAARLHTQDLRKILKAAFEMSLGNRAHLPSPFYLKRAGISFHPKKYSLHPSPEADLRLAAA